MLYILNFDIKDSSRVELFNQKLNSFGEGNLFMPKCYFLKAGDELKAEDIYKQLKAVLQEEDLILLTPVDLNSMNGWLSSSTIEWLKKT